MIGQTISHYKITEKLGEGGMGVVYKAEDTRLDRIVALKFLAQDLMRDEENRKRFLREAKAAAGINHPNVCTVHEISDVDGRDFLALEYIDGETLDATIAQGPLKVEEALEIARQVADGLAAAHEKNVVHRDIKPGNLMIIANGRVKTLDFGLALLTEKSKLTQLDTAVGTAAYMSPEQMQAQEVDHRTDIWALGCVLYEMVAAQRAFRGEYAQAMACEIVHENPEPLTGLRTGVPMELEFMVGKCLEKDAGKRYPNAAEVGVDLGNLLDKLKSGRSRPLASAAAIQVRPAAPRELSPAEQSFLDTYRVIEDLESADDRSAYRAEDTQLKRSVTINILPESAAREAVRRQRAKDRALAAAAVLLVALSAVVVGLWRGSGGPAEPPPLRRFAYASPRDISPDFFTAPVAISPNGKHIAIGDQGRQGLWVQDLDHQQPRAIEGTAGARAPFWSPDSNFIAFAAAGELKKVSVQGGASIRVCELPGGIFPGGSWSPDGEVIVFSSGSPLALYEVAARGGPPNLLISTDDGSEPSSEALTGAVLSPHFLPVEAGRRVLAFTFGTSTEQTMMVQDLESGRRERLGSGHQPFYSAGRLVYQSSPITEDLWALPFSLETLTAAGEAFPIAQTARGPTAAADGTLVYFDGAGSQEERLAWRDRSGERLREVGRPHPGIHSFDMSPDGRQAVVSIEGDIYVEDLERGVSTQLTFTDEPEQFPVWAPWGAVFARGDPELLFRPLDRSREMETLVGGAEGLPVAYDVDPGGRTVLYGVAVSPTNYDILHLERSPDGSLSEPKVFLADPFETVDAQISPDGRHVAYSSRVTDRWDVLVQPFPDGGPQVQLTPEGGSQVRWNPNGKELFFVLEDTLYAVAVTAEPEFRAGKPRALFSDAAFRTRFARPRYDVAPGGDRFLLAEPVTDDEVPKPRIRVVQNWAEEFRGRERD